MMCYLTAIWWQSNEAFGGHYDFPIGWESRGDVKCCRGPGVGQTFERVNHIKYVLDCCGSPVDITCTTQVTTTGFTSVAVGHIKR